MISESQILLSAFLAGIYIPFLYDLVKGFRIAIPHTPVFMSLEDLIYWIIIFLDIFTWMQEESNGTLRWFAVFGLLVGMLLYKLVVADGIVRQIARILQVILSTICKVLHIISRPIAKNVAYVRKIAKHTNSTKLKYTRYVKNELKIWIRLFTMKLRKK